MAGTGAFCRSSEAVLRDSASSSAASLPRAAATECGPSCDGGRDDGALLPPRWVSVVVGTPFDSTYAAVPSLYVNTTAKCMGRATARKKCVSQGGGGGKQVLYRLLRSNAKVHESTSYYSDGGKLRGFTSLAAQDKHSPPCFPALKAQGRHGQGQCQHRVSSSQPEVPWRRSDTASQWSPEWFCT